MPTDDFEVKKQEVKYCFDHSTREEQLEMLRMVIQDLDLEAYLKVDLDRVGVDPPPSW